MHNEKTHKQQKSAVTHVRTLIQLLESESDLLAKYVKHTRNLLSQWLTITAHDPDVTCYTTPLKGTQLRHAIVVTSVIPLYKTSSVYCTLFLYNTKTFELVYVLNQKI